MHYCVFQHLNVICFQIQRMLEYVTYNKILAKFFHHCIKLFEHNKKNVEGSKSDLRVRLLRHLLNNAINNLLSQFRRLDSCQEDFQNIIMPIYRIINQEREYSGLFNQIWTFFLVAWKSVSALHFLYCLLVQGFHRSAFFLSRLDFFEIKKIKTLLMWDPSAMGF